MFRFMSLVAMGCALTGCAIHPTVDDRTGLRTDVVVQRIRCETRDALRKELVWYLTKKSADQKAKDLGKLLERPSEPIPVAQVDALADPIINKFRKSGIAYSFSFDMTEINNFGGGLNAVRPLDNGTHLFGFGGGTDRKRRAIRSFTVTDTFENLLTSVNPQYCSGELPPPNYMYPIAGTIGVEEMVQAFTNLAVTSTLIGKEDGPPTMTDTFEFTTKISASASPKLELNPVRNTLRLADASIAAAVSREDIHQVVIGFALPVEKPKAKEKKEKGPEKTAAPDKEKRNVADKGRAAGASKALLNLNVITAIGNSTEAAAAEAVDKHILRYEMWQRR